MHTRKTVTRRWGSRTVTCRTNPRPRIGAIEQLRVLDHGVLRDSATRRTVAARPLPDGRRALPTVCRGHRGYASNQRVAGWIIAICQAVAVIVDGVEALFVTEFVVRKTAPRHCRCTRSRQPDTDSPLSKLQGKLQTSAPGSFYASIEPSLVPKNLARANFGPNVSWPMSTCRRSGRCLPLGRSCRRRICNFTPGVLRHPCSPHARRRSRRILAVTGAFWRGRQLEAARQATTRVHLPRSVAQAAPGRSWHDDSMP